MIWGSHISKPIPGNVEQKIEQTKLPDLSAGKNLAQFVLLRAVPDTFQFQLVADPFFFLLGRASVHVRGSPGGGEISRHPE